MTSRDRHLAIWLGRELSDTRAIQRARRLPTKRRRTGVPVIKIGSVDASGRQFVKIKQFSGGAVYTPQACARVCVAERQWPIPITSMKINLTCVALSPAGTR